MCCACFLLQTAAVARLIHARAWPAAPQSASPSADAFVDIPLHAWHSDTPRRPLVTLLHLWGAGALVQAAGGGVALDAAAAAKSTGPAARAELAMALGAVPSNRGPRSLWHPQDATRPDAERLLRSIAQGGLRPLHAMPSHAIAAVAAGRSEWDRQAVVPLLQRAGVLVTRPTDAGGRHAWARAVTATICCPPAASSTAMHLRRLLWQHGLLDNRVRAGGPRCARWARRNLTRVRAWMSSRAAR